MEEDFLAVEDHLMPKLEPLALKELDELASFTRLEQQIGVHAHSVAKVSSEVILFGKKTCRKWN